MRTVMVTAKQCTKTTAATPQAHGTWKKTAPRNQAGGEVGRGVVGGGTGPLGVYSFGKTLHVWAEARKTSASATETLLKTNVCLDHRVWVSWLG